MVIHKFNIGLILLGLGLIIAAFRTQGAHDTVQTIDLDMPMSMLCNASGKVAFNSSAPVTIDRFMDIHDLPRFTEHILNLPSPFIYLTKPTCSETDLFVTELVKSYSISDTMRFDSYVGYQVRKNQTKSLFQSQNHFEMMAPDWSGRENIANEMYGNHYQDLSQQIYSTTYTHALPDIDIENQWSVNVKVNIRNYIGFSSKLICAVSNKEGEFHRMEKTLPSRLRGNSSWNSVQNIFQIAGHTLQEGDTLSIYIWNPRLEQLEIDNFEVELLVEQPTF
jgi:hypothetical protein